MLPDDVVADLIARAEAPTRFPELGFVDPVAEELLRAVDVDTTTYDDRRLRATLLRTMIVDAVVASFFQRQPDGLALAFRPGLCTRFDRVDNGSLHWIDFDAAPVAELKTNVLPPDPRHVRTCCCSARCSRWLDCLGGTAQIPTILVVEGALLRAPVEDLEQFFVDAAEKVGVGTELVMPRIRFVGCDAYLPPLAHALDGYHGVSRLFRGRTLPSLAHLRFV